MLEHTQFTPLYILPPKEVERSTRHLPSSKSPITKRPIIHLVSAPTATIVTMLPAGVPPPYQGRGGYN